MSDQTQEKSTTTKRPGRYVLLGVAISLLTLAVAVILLWSRLRLPSIEERLAAIEADRAIPDSENAAILYNRLIADANATSFDHHPAFLDKNSGNLTLHRPWATLDYPELADWIKERQWLIDKLRLVSQFEECRFPINIDLYTSTSLQHTSIMRKWALLLARAANNDIREGRSESAMTKWRCIILMAGHLYQQPTAIERIYGIALEQLSIGQLAVFLIEGDASKRHLKRIESLPLQTRDDWPAVLETILSVEELVEQKVRQKLNLADRLEFEFRKETIVGMSDPQRKELHWLYTKSLVVNRGINILVAMRHYWNEHGSWPDSLERLRPTVPTEMLVDPFNKGDFAYKLTGDGFTLYSKGMNNIDEGGQHSSGFQKGPDDWPIWPPRGRKRQARTVNPK